MSMPIYGDMKDVTFQNHPFYPVVESPGVVFIVKKEDSSNAAQAVMEAVFQGWPVLLLTLIMAALSGIVVWALVSSCSNPFSSPKPPVPLSRRGLVLVPSLRRLRGAGGSEDENGRNPLLQEPITRRVQLPY